MAAPRVSIETVRTTSAGPDGAEVEWRVTNLGDAPVRLVAVAAPHRLFRADDLSLGTTLPPSGATVVTLRVASHESSGAEIENAFLIFTAEVGGSTWLILTRMRVRVDADGMPCPVVERIDVQEVGSNGQG